jgi:hypothetical protein
MIITQVKFQMSLDLSRDMETYNLSPDKCYLSQETNEMSRETDQMSLDRRPAF